MDKRQKIGLTVGLGLVGIALATEVFGPAGWAFAAEVSKFAPAVLVSILALVAASNADETARRSEVESRAARASAERGEAEARAARASAERGEAEARLGREHAETARESAGKPRKRGPLGRLRSWLRDR